MKLLQTVDVGDTNVKTNTNAFVNFLDRLLNRNQAGTGSNLNTNNNNNVVGSSSVAATTRRTTSGSLLGSLVFVPDVSKGVDTILGGVATGNLEQIISGSFIFAPPRVQNVANNVINRVFGGPSIGTLGNGNNGNRSNSTTNQGGNNQVPGSGSNLVEAVKNIQMQQTSQPPITPPADIGIRVQGANTSTTSGGFFSNIFGGLYSKSAEMAQKEMSAFAAGRPVPSK